MTPAETLLALCEDVEGLAGPHAEECRGSACVVYADHTEPEGCAFGPCSCGQAERVRALKARAAALKVCVEGLEEAEAILTPPRHRSAAGRARTLVAKTLSEAARLASSEGEEK